MSFFGSLWFFGLTIMTLVSKSKYVHAAITCQDAVTQLQPCLPFLTGEADSPVFLCCQNVAKINDAASTTEIRRNLCKCFKKIAPAIGVKPDRAKQLPQLCAVDVPVPIDRSVCIE